eukprot:4554639-Prymnesium_polylepis.1
MSDTSRSAALLSLATAFVCELVLCWPVHADSALIRAAFMWRAPWLVAAIAAVASTLGALAAATAAQCALPT